jgi:hypothetical protein
MTNKLKRWKIPCEKRNFQRQISSIDGRHPERGRILRGR